MTKLRFKGSFIFLLIRIESILRATISIFDSFPANLIISKHTDQNKLRVLFSEEFDFSRISNAIYNNVLILIAFKNIPVVNFFCQD